MSWGTTTAIRRWFAEPVGRAQFLTRIAPNKRGREATSTG